MTTHTDHQLAGLADCTSTAPYGCTLAFHYAVDHDPASDRWAITRHGITLTRHNDIADDLADIEFILTSEFAALTGIPRERVHVVGLVAL